MDIQFISATAENAVNLISIAARFGQKIVLTNCDSGFLPAAVIPYLRYSSVGYKIADSAQISIDDSTIMDFGLIAPDATLLVSTTTEKLSEVSPLFRMFIVSSVNI